MLKFCPQVHTKTSTIKDAHARMDTNKLSSLNDARIIRTVLETHAFKSENITTLVDEHATKSKILNALETLIFNALPGDVLVFHFSGHGQQITDLNGDEVDGYDEALIPFDAYKTLTKDYKGDNHLIDDELNSYLLRMRKKVGPKGDVIFIIDSCHSGTATRGHADDNVFRGTSEKFNLGKNSISEKKEAQSFFDEQRNVQSDDSLLSPYAVFSASGQQELNMEVKDQENIRYGSLSYAIAKALTSNLKNISYKAVFEILKNEMHDSFKGKHIQTPQIEGVSDRLLFGGKGIDIPIYCRIVSIVNSGKIIINKGQLNGLTSGSEITFYPVNTVNPEFSTMVASGIIVKTGFVESEVEITSVNNEKLLKHSWGFVTKLNWHKLYPSPETMRASILRRAAAFDPELRVEFELVRNNSIAGQIDNLFKAGDLFHLKVINKGLKDAYFQIIGIQSDDEVYLLFNETIITPDDLFIKAGETKELKKYVFRVTPPFGSDMLKLIASERQLDLTPIRTRHPVAKRGGESAEFELLLNDLFDNTINLRSGRLYNKVAIYSLAFSILEN